MPNTTTIKTLATAEKGTKKLSLRTWPINKTVGRIMIIYSLTSRSIDSNWLVAFSTELPKNRD